MFGFLRGPKQPAYRQAYARCCSMQRSVCGYRSLPVISYESVFAYCLAIDFQLIPRPRENDPHCCRARQASRFAWESKERLAAEFCAHLAMLLVQTKLADDIQDSPKFSASGLLGRLGHLALRRPFGRSRCFLDTIDSKFQHDLDKCFEDHRRLESSTVAPMISEYVRPTAKAFARVFGLLPRLMQSGNSISDFEAIGEKIGAAIIAFDCAVDWKRDQRSGDYNPLQGEQGVELAMERCLQDLVAAGWLIAESTGHQSISASVLRHQVQRVAKRRNSSTNPRARELAPSRQFAFRSGAIDLECLCWLVDASVCCEPNCCGKKSQDDKADAKANRKRRKRLKERGGFCDCDCGGCDGCDCDGCDCDSGFDGESNCGWFDGDLCCFAYYDSCNDGKKDSNDDSGTVESQTPQQDTYVGKRGITVTQLAPFGTIRVEGKEHAAKSQGQMIEASKDIVIIQKEAFGYLVRESKDDPEVD